MSEELDALRLDKNFFEGKLCRAHSFCTFILLIGPIDCSTQFLKLILHVVLVASKHIIDFTSGLKQAEKEV